MEIGGNIITFKSRPEYFELEKDDIIKQFEELEKIEPNVKNILEPLYDNRDYVYEQNGMKV